MAELVTRKVLVERRRLHNQITKELREAERRDTNDPVVATAIGIMRDILTKLEGNVDIEVHCIMQCGATERVTVAVNDEHDAMPSTMLCGACSKTAEA